MANAIKRKRFLKLLITLVVLLLINFPPFNIPFILIDRDDCRFSNADGSFTFKEITFKHHDYETSCKASFSQFKNQVRAREYGFESKDTLHLYRVTAKNPLKVYRYKAYLTEEKYKVDYADWDEIEQARGQFEPSGYRNF
jgi:hypothetical protein